MYVYMNNQNTLLVCSVLTCIVFFCFIMPKIDKKNIRENFDNLI